MNIDSQTLDGWVGRTESSEDAIGATPVVALGATLDCPASPVVTGQPLPYLWHWLYFLPMYRQSEADHDGHAKRGSFLPAVPLPRRMWAGSQLQFDSPIRVGDTVQRMSTIEDVRAKSGRSGEMVFVKVRHELRCNGERQAAITEFHDIVYRAAKLPGDAEPTPVAAPTDAQFSREVLADELLLFRYSALTFNGHRIHYDRRYVTEIEGYPGLVVHGPLIATLLMDLLRREMPQADVASFNFKALRPSFDGHALRVNGQRDGNRVRLWAQDHEGWLTMDATANLR